MRIAVRFGVRVANEQGEEIKGCWARDLSGGGMLFGCPQALLLGARVAVSFEVDESIPPFEVKGSVQRVRPSLGFSQKEKPFYLAAVSFFMLQKSMARRLRRHVMEQIMALVERLREFPAFGRLSEFDLVTLSGVCHKVDLRAGDVLVRQGDEASSVFVVRTGLVKLTGRGDKEGHQASEVASCGQIFGEVSTLTGLPHDLDIAALEDTELVALTRDGLHFLKETHPETALRLMEIFMRFTGMRMRRLTRRIFSPLTIQ